MAQGLSGRDDARADVADAPRDMDTARGDTARGDTARGTDADIAFDRRANVPDRSAEPEPGAGLDRTCDATAAPPAPPAPGAPPSSQVPPAPRAPWTRNIRLPRSRPARIALGVGLVLGGTVGFLPIVGFWMLPLGLYVLSHDFASVRRFRRRSTVRLLRWWRSRG